MKLYKRNFEINASAILDATSIQHQRIEEKIIITEEWFLIDWIFPVIKQEHIQHISHDGEVYVPLTKEEMISEIACHQYHSNNAWYVGFILKNPKYNIM